MKYYLLIGLVLAAFSASAREDTIFVYTKTLLKIIPKAETLAPATAASPEKKDTDKKDGEAIRVIDPAILMPAMQRAPKEFTVEVRAVSFLAQKDFIAHQPFTDREGMLILIDPPAEATLGPTRIISSADVLFVDADGVIIKIAPSIKLNGMAETIPSGMPIRAFVYLKAGTTISSDIRLGDRIENAFFKTHPVVIG